VAGRALLSRMSGAAGPADEVEAIVAHLRVLLNTRQGEAPSAPDYGIVDFSDMVHVFPGAVQDLARSIRATILQYEPRLKNVTVRHLPEAESLSLRFDISAQLAGGRSAKVLHLATTVRPGGRVDVSG
jgi:type VI secretion system protein